MKPNNQMLLIMPLLASLLLGYSLILDQNDMREKLADEIEYSIHHQLLNKWYPAALDKEYGGFLSNFIYDFQPEEKQEKMIVSQSRQVWTASKAAVYYPEKKEYLEIARQGFNFLRDKFWDQEFGGFHTLTDRSGKVLDTGLEAKTAYGNAFAIY